MVGHLADLGYRTVYSAAGPKVLHLLLAGGVLDRLYLTYANRLLGGGSFATIVDGDLFTPTVDMRLVSVYFDAQALGGLGQLFVAYKRA
jgi:riboflavin biosynthesis pyrimidine reductase